MTQDEIRKEAERLFGSRTSLVFINAAIDFAEHILAKQWRPIEDAPKDENIQILTFRADFPSKIGRNKLQRKSAVWYQTSFWSNKFGLFVGWPLNMQPTHWMPLPPAPEVK